MPPELLGGEHEYKGRGIPDRYGLTQRFMLLRACERMGGGRPAVWVAQLSAGEEAELLAFERIRQHQESKAAEAMMAAGLRLG